MHGIVVIQDNTSTSLLVARQGCFWGHSEKLKENSSQGICGFQSQKHKALIRDYILMTVGRVGIGRYP